MNSVRSLRPQLTCLLLLMLAPTGFALPAAGANPLPVPEPTATPLPAAPIDIPTPPATTPKPDAAPEPPLAPSLSETTPAVALEEGNEDPAAAPPPLANDSPATKLVQEPPTRAAGPRKKKGARRQKTKRSRPPVQVVLEDAMLRTELAAGVHFTWLNSPNYDLFSASDLLVAGVLRAATTVWKEGRLSVAVATSSDLARKAAAARSVPSQLELVRVLAGAELRGQLVDRLSAHTRLLGGVALVSSQLGVSGPEALGLVNVEGAIQLGAGVALRLAGSPDGRVHTPRLHLSVEGGYCFTPETGLIYRPGADGPERAQPLDLGGLSLSGPQLAFTLSGSL